MKIKVNFLKGALLLLLFAASSSFALAQRTISGLVTDESNGETLIGASVVVTGTTKGTLTDVDGKYSLDVPADAKSLTFSFTGYSSLTIPLGASNVVNAPLKGGATFTEVVINAGYATIRQKESSGSITSVKAEDFNRGNVNDPMQLLQGKVAGLSISRPGGDPNGGYSIRLRGLSTIGANIEPLIVIDGVPGGSLNSVDPTDIESMDVLKDGSASAIYGTRGSSGVILITTKKGSAGKTTVDYNGTMSSEAIANSVKVMTASQYAAAGGSNLNQNTDWLSLVTRTANSQVHNLSISGGIGKSTYRAAFNYRGIQGIGLKDGYNQLNARVDLSQKALDDKLTLTFGLAATSKDATYARPEAFRYAMLFNPTAPVNENPANPQYIKYGGYYQSESFDYFNPKAIADQSTNEGSLKRILASAKAEYELMKGWKAGLMYSQNRENDIFNDYYSRNGYFRRTTGAKRFTQESVNDYLSATTTYEQRYGNIGFKGLAGYDYQEFVYSNFGMQGGDILSDAYSYNRPSASLDFLRGTAAIQGTKNSHKLIAFFARAAVNIDDIYSISATLRREGSSRFGTNNKWGLFPAISGAVNIDKLAKIKGIDQLKFRVGYGVTGALPGESYLSLSTMTPGANFLYKGVFVPAYGIARNANPDLKWEKKESLILV